MDFTLDEAGAAVAEAADEVVNRLSPDWTAAFDADGFDRAAWAALTGAGLTVLGLPVTAGGDGLALDALAPLAVRAGRGAVVTPLIATLTGTAALAHDDEAARRWAPVVTGGGWFAVALGERNPAPGAPSRLALDAAGRLSGTAVGVQFAEGAGALLVQIAGGAAVVDPSAPGVLLTRTPSSTGAAEFAVTFDGAQPAAVLDGAPLGDVYRALCAAYADGLLAGAMERTAAHVSERQQFGKPIAAFQAVGQQLADVYVVSRTLHLIATSAAWRLAAGRNADEDLATASYWLAAELPAALRTMTHLHGGIGVDRSYPLHRYFSLAKDLARLAGGSTAALDALADVTVKEAACSPN
ncbi:acyl-CoA dehydrogenase family protein [Gordonia sp. (in: high G+C Gram-positive bacteria)]|uniref:acyl-CoA dehydrogenase family protein n=1 Tax=Gordonia sp. (in: high G+C Gram-positive bacteria) TaxID=84139 RepID=UPI003528731E